MQGTASINALLPIQSLALGTVDKSKSRQEGHRYSHILCECMYITKVVENHPFLYKYINYKFKNGFISLGQCLNLWEVKEGQPTSLSRQRAVMGKSLAICDKTQCSMTYSIQQYSVFNNEDACIYVTTQQSSISIKIAETIHSLDLTLTRHSQGEEFQGIPKSYSVVLPQFLLVADSMVQYLFNKNSEITSFWFHQYDKLQVNKRIAGHC